MKAELIEPEPKSQDVQITMTRAEAEDLKALIGRTTHRKREECFEYHCPFPDVFSKIYIAIDQVLS